MSPARRRRSPPAVGPRGQVDHLQPLAREIHEDFVARDMVLAHGRRQSALELAEQVAEPATAVSTGLALAVFLPQRHQRHAGPHKFARNHRPVRLDPAPEAWPAARWGKQQLLQHFLDCVVGQWPGQSGSLDTRQVILDRASGNADTARERAVAQVGRRCA